MLDCFSEGIIPWVLGMIKKHTQHVLMCSYHRDDKSYDFNENFEYDFNCDDTKAVVICKNICIWLQERISE